MNEKDHPSSGPGPAQRVPSSAGGLVELVLERLKSLEGLSGLKAGHEDTGWWRKRTRMVLESVAEADASFKSVLSAFDSLKLGKAQKGAAGDLSPDEFQAEIAKARNLLKNLIREMGDFPGTAEEASRKTRTPSAAESAAASKPAESEIEDQGGEVPSLVPEIQNLLNEIVEKIERHPGLSAHERNDCRLDVRSLRNELLKSHPNRARVMGLLEALAFLEVDFASIRRVV